MGYREQSIILFLIISSLAAWSHLGEGSRWSLSIEEDLEIERQLKLLNKPYVKSFKTGHGDTFDCVDVFKQPSLDHPLLKNHKVQLRPSPVSQGSPSEYSSRKRVLKPNFKERCPEGTVLIRRTLKEDLIRAKETVPDLNGSHYAGVVIETYHNKYYGAQALLDVYNVQNVSDNQASTVQVILSQAETGTTNYLNIIQFGWQVNPSVTTDKQVRLFTYWTSDGYQNSGCYNLLCLGFVITGTNWTPGMVIPNGTPSLKLTAFKSSTGDWWLAVGDSEEPIGYWPKNLFKNGMTDITEIQMAGIVNSPYNEPSPPMCNGFLPKPNHPYGSKSCEFKQIRVKIEQGHFADPHLDLVKFICDSITTLHRSDILGLVMAVSSTLVVLEVTSVDEMYEYCIFKCINLDNNMFLRMN